VSHDVVKKVCVGRREGRGHVASLVAVRNGPAEAAPCVVEATADALLYGLV
jgi:hypothetical protein